MNFRKGQYVVPIVSYTENMPGIGIDHNKLYRITSTSNEHIWIMPIGKPGQEYGATEDNLRSATGDEVRLYAMLFR